jgi:hypothetical protein
VLQTEFKKEGNVPKRARAILEEIAAVVVQFHHDRAVLFLWHQLLCGRKIEVAAHVSPDGVNMIGIILSIIVLDDERGALDHIVMAFVQFRFAPPAHSNVIHP